MAISIALLQLDSIEEGYEFGYFQKPFNILCMRACINKVLPRKQSAMKGVF